MRYAIESDEGFTLENLIAELGRLELDALGYVKHGDVRMASERLSRLQRRILAWRIQEYWAPLGDHSHSQDRGYQAR
jgi:hypothetical protein